jgi:hypothetical protein
MNTDRHFRDLVMALSESNHGQALSLADRLISQHKQGEQMPRWPDVSVVPGRHAFILGRTSMAVDLGATDLYYTQLQAIRARCARECGGQS